MFRTNFSTIAIMATIAATGLLSACADNNAPSKSDTPSLPYVMIPGKDLLSMPADQPYPDQPLVLLEGAPARKAAACLGTDILPFADAARVKEVYVSYLMATDDLPSVTTFVGPVGKHDRAIADFSTNSAKTPTLLLKAKGYGLDAPGTRAELDAVRRHAFICVKKTLDEQPETPVTQAEVKQVARAQR